jgi:hypothetical protein
VDEQHIWGAVKLHIRPNMEKTMNARTIGES